MNKVKFNVLLYSQDKIEYYDVLPYFRECWKDSLKHKKDKQEQIKNRESLKQWIIDKAGYMYRARCQYEFLMAKWPFGSYQLNKDIEAFLTPEFNINDYKQNIDFYNIIIKDMHKIDIYEQIMMNIEIITDIFMQEIKNAQIK